MMKRWILWILLLMMIFLVACTPTEGSAPDVEPVLTAVLEGKSTATPIPGPTSRPAETAVIPPSPSPAAETADQDEPDKTDAAPAEPVLTFRRTGGFAGLDQQWTIFADGRIELPDGAQKQIEANQVQALLETIQAAHFFDLADSYVPLDACCDRFYYTITIQVDGQHKTVETIDDAPKQPEQLTAVMEAINKLLLAPE